MPKELNEDERREAASRFAERLTGGERLPYTLAIHRGGTNGENPHAHLMFSERSGEQWFKRYNAKAPEKGGARKSRAAKAGDWLDKTRQVWEQTANRALERAGRGERIDCRSLAERRHEAYRAGDLERAAQLSREPNVHLGPERYRTIRGGASETVQQAGRVDRINAADRGERDADSRQVERLEREITGVEAQLKETYDRVRTAIDKRIRQARRAIRRGSEAAGLRRTFAKLAHQGRAPLEQIQIDLARPRLHPDHRALPGPGPEPPRRPLRPVGARGLGGVTVGLVSVTLLSGSGTCLKQDPKDGSSQAVKKAAWSRPA